MPERFLILQTAFLGDVILTLPVLQVLKKNYPEAKIDLVLIPSTAEIVKNNPYVNEVIVYDKRNDGLKGMSKLLKKLREKKYDYIITPHRSFRSAFISRMSNARMTITFDRSSSSFLYDTKVEYQTRVHEIQRNLSLLKPLGINESGIIRPDIFPGEEAKKKIEDRLLSINILLGEKFITVAPGSVWFTKRFPEEKFVCLFEQIGNDLKIILIGGNRDKKYSSYIKENFPHENLIDMTGELSILESAELIRRSSLLITNDSAPLHIGNAMETPVIALFGSTVPELGFFPYRKKDKIFEMKGLPCRPCTDHGRRKCPIGSFICMNELEEKKIAEAVKSLLYAR